MEAKPRVFVYGTLRKGYSNHGVLGTADFCGSARTREKYALFLGRYPLVVKDRPESPIRGEVYAVDPGLLSRLDELEGHPSWYVRELVPVILDTGKEMWAWMYFFPVAEGVFVHGGDIASAADWSKG